MRRTLSFLWVFSLAFPLALVACADDDGDGDGGGTGVDVADTAESDGDSGAVPGDSSEDAPEVSTDVGADTPDAGLPDVDPDDAEVPRDTTAPDADVMPADTVADADATEPDVAADVEDQEIPGPDGFDSEIIEADSGEDVADTEDTTDPPDVCNPECEGKQCGDDGCGGMCGECEATQYCDEELQCAPLSDCPKIAGTCDLEAPAKNGLAFKVTSLQIGTNGKPGSALDIDDKGPADCAPKASCSDGIDNTLASLAGAANTALTNSLNVGNIKIVGELTAEPGNGPFEVRLYQGVLDESNPACAFQTEVCLYDLDIASWDCDCNILTKFLADVEGGVVHGGGPGTTYTLLLPVGTALLPLKAYSAEIQFEYTITAKGVQIKNGIIGGGVYKADLIAAFEALDPAVLPIPKEFIISILNGLAPDVDTDADGVDESLSFGLMLIAIEAEIDGVAP